ncbi:MAG TPA: hypothetical protein VFA75_00265 [Nevskia sp.]|nr:hypothetical protein [Nevskia sp.]
MVTDDVSEAFKQPLLVHAFKAIAPERGAELATEEALTIEVTSTEGFVAESVLAERLISFSRGALELFWCIAYFNVVVMYE